MPNPIPQYKDVTRGYIREGDEEMIPPISAWVIVASRNVGLNVRSFSERRFRRPVTSANQRQTPNGTPKSLPKFKNVTGGYIRAGDEEMVPPIGAWIVVAARNVGLSVRLFPGRRFRRPIESISAPSGLTADHLLHHD
jgi:hypothetical protein